MRKDTSFPNYRTQESLTSARSLIELPSPTQEIGFTAEQFVCQWLSNKGYLIRQSNYRAGRAEIDIVAQDPGKGGEIVFIEVKWRKRGSLTRPESSVTHTKQRHIIRAANQYLLEHRLENAFVRFDVVSVQGTGLHPTVVHIKSAFGN